jgi:tetratricopeptide (TPR) repeat protein
MTSLFSSSLGRRALVSLIALAVAGCAAKPAMDPSPKSDDCGAAFFAGVTGDAAAAIVKITEAIHENPGSWQCLSDRGQLYLQKGAEQKAIADFSSAIDKSGGKETRLYDMRSVAYWNAGLWDHALADATVVVSRNPKYAFAYFVQGSNLNRLGRFQDALPALDEALRLDAQPTRDGDARLEGRARPMAYVERGFALDRLGKYAESLASLDRNLDLTERGDMLEWHFLKGHAEWKLNQMEKARQDAAGCLELQPRLTINFSGVNTLDLFDLEKRRAITTEAIQVAEAAEAKSAWSEAFEAWTRAESYASGYMQDGFATQSKITDGTIRTYSKLTTKPAVPELARQFLIKAEAYLDEKKYDDAISAYREVSSIAVWLPDAYFNRAQIEAEQSQIPAAIEDMKTYLRLVPNGPDSRKAQDQIYVWQTKIQ